MEPQPRPDRPRELAVRFLLMVFFVVVVQLVELVLGFLILVQFLSHAFTGQPLGELRRLGAALADYARAILRYLAYDTEERPYPFSPWRAAEARGLRPEPGQPG